MALQEALDEDARAALALRSSDMNDIQAVYTRLLETLDMMRVWSDSSLVPRGPIVQAMLSSLRYWACLGRSRSRVEGM